MWRLCLVVALLACAVGASVGPESERRFGEAYLQRMRAVPGVHALDSGVLYQRLQIGPGQSHPEPGDELEVHLLRSCSRPAPGCIFPISGFHVVCFGIWTLIAVAEAVLGAHNRTDAPQRPPTLSQHLPRLAERENVVEGAY